MDHFSSIIKMKFMLKTHFDILLSYYVKENLICFLNDEGKFTK